MRKVVSLMVMFVLCTTLALAQNRVVTGQVTDDKGDPVPYASIKVKNGKAGVSADANGNYKIEVKEGSTLVISATGSVDKEIQISGSSATYNVSLSKSNTELSTVVVSALGVKRSAKSTTYATQTITADRLTKTRETDVSTALAGKVAGLQVLGQSTAKLGTNGAIRLRGVGSLAGANALFVVDGTILLNASDINMDDVESVTVLKGRAASALYGGRANGGVILITTKKARKGRSTPLGVDFNQTTTFDKVAQLPAYQNSYMGGPSQTWSTYTYSAGNPTDWQALSGKRFHLYNDDASWGPAFDGGDYIPWYAWFPGTQYSFKTAKAVAQPDNIRNFYDMGVTANNNISLTKGWKTVATKVNYSYLTQNGILPYSWRNKHLVSSQTSWDIIPKLTLGVNANYSNERIRGDFADGYSNQTSGNFNQWFHRDLDMGIMKELVDFKTPAGYSASWNHGNPSSTANYQNGSINKGNYWYNTYTYLKYAKSDQWRDRIFGDISLKYNILKNLDVAATYRLNYRKTRSGQSIPSLIENSASQTGLISSFTNNNTKYVEHNYELLVTYKKNWNDFTLDALAGGNYLKYSQRDSNRATAGGLTQTDIFDIANSVGAPTLTAGYADKKIVSGFGRVTLGYKDFLFADASLRADWSSWLPAANNRFLFPSYGLSYVFTDHIKKAIPSLSYGKLRVSSASSGDDNNLGSYRGNLNYTTGNIPYNSSYISTVPNTLVDPAIKPAITTEYEAGLELRFLRDRIGINATYFRENRKDEIVSTNVTSASGFTFNTFNVGKINRNGIELTLDVKPIQSKNFTWDVSFNWSHITSFVEKVSEQSKSITISAAPQFGGIPLPIVYATEGENWGQLRGTGIKRINGNAVLNDDGSYVAETNTNFGSTLPNYLGGVFNQFTYKGVSLSFSLDYKQGGKYFSLSDFWGTYSGLFAKTAAINDNGKNVRDPLSEGGGVHVYGVKADGKAYDTYVDAYDYFHQFGNNGGIADMSVFDASYLKVREVSLGYTLPVAKWGWKWVKRANVSVVARNPWMIWAANRDYDPSETVSEFGEGGQLPGTRSLGVNLKFGF